MKIKIYNGIMKACYEHTKILNKKLEDLVQEAITEIIDTTRPLGRSGGKIIYADCPPKDDLVTASDIRFGRDETVPEGG